VSFDVNDGDGEGTLENWEINIVGMKEYERCETSEYRDDCGTCHECDERCLTCTGPLETECVTCPYRIEPVDGRCP